MEVMPISEFIELTTTDDDPWNWPQHPDDEGLPKFITYIGGNNYSKLDGIIAHIPYPVRSLRRDAKHFRKKFKYELKIWGMAWEDCCKLSSAMDKSKWQPKEIGHLLKAS